ncbi:hypothetical protein [Pyruvatibacter sp.]|uniref:hypothetical protein n=1 Tax=Pyruvatibacter sp. TaxID=1981328 RepID=UPI003263AA21
MAQILRLRLVAAIALYVTSLTLPGLYLEGHDPAFGWDILMRGWFGIAILEIAWISNILFAIALVATLMERPMAAAYIASAAFLIGLLSLRSTIWVFHNAPITGLGSGFYVWMTAFAVLALASFAARNERSRTPGLSV